MKLILLLVSCIVAGAFRSLNSRVFSPLRGNTLSMYNVKIVNKKLGTEFIVDTPPGAIILDYAETKGVSIPYSCRAGSCSSCVGLVKDGEIDQTGQIFLSDKQMDDGFVLTCVATALTDCTIEVDIEDLFYNLNPDMVEE
ncbi:2Fe-2S ferredoxin-type domain-containing protein [Ochromonadaceae sp. CCMP2298]|nr:2Fe-2S ferredoxin-type domain-containing protein [Ochromonadaceae sp. CCMP2298]|mmetsp:Transcript_18695/g.41609  ORF Transcript_18695/g.41609 Transcript_18695/m.41609 type:complete len:140 (-) Transcript_18695:1113-1532(-)